jgi:hypothetical protein
MHARKNLAAVKSLEAACGPRSRTKVSFCAFRLYAADGDDVE